MREKPQITQISQMTEPREFSAEDGKILPELERDNVRVLMREQ
jgi:hypothetical protein